MTDTVPTTALSQVSVKEALQTFIKSKPDYLRWKDFYDSSTGIALIELISAIGSYIAFSNLSLRREAYLYDSKIRSSAVAIAETLGYSVYRGRNEHLSITLEPTQSGSLGKYSLIGKCGEESIVLAKPTNFFYGEEVTIEVIIGTPKEESINITSEDMTMFRFHSPDISEDFVLYLNDLEVPTSKEILDLMSDYYVTLTNAFEGMDILYLNRFEPSVWVSNKQYNSGESIKPDFIRRISTEYTYGMHVVPSNESSVLFVCVSGGTTGEDVVEWPVNIGDEVSDGEVTWKNVGTVEGDLYFKSISTVAGYSGSVEPIWPVSPGSVVSDGDIQWECTKDTRYSSYTYNTGGILRLLYIELNQISYVPDDIDLFYGNLLSYKRMSSFNEKETPLSIKTNAPLFHETKHVIRAREDYRKVLKEILPNVVDTNGHDLSPASIELTYVKNHTTDLWESRKYVAAGQKVMPSVPNGMVYVAESSGYTEVSIKGVSGEVEPEWPTEIGTEVVDNQVVWVIGGTVQGFPYWEPGKIYNVNDRVTPVTPTGFFYTPVRMNVEPSWPTDIGSTVTDNEVLWKCIDNIFLKGYDSKVWEPNFEVGVGDFVVPISSTKFFYRSTEEGFTGQEEPIWPQVIGTTVDDGIVVWECWDFIDSDTYQKNRALELLSQYRIFGIQPPIISDPILVFVALSINVTLISGDVLTQTVKNDIDSILEGYERVLAYSLNVDDVEAKIESLEYVKVARVSVKNDSKTVQWERDTKYRLYDTVFPSPPNGFIYECSYIKDNFEDGFSQGDEGAYASGYEPSWISTIDQTIDSVNIRWRCVEFEEAADVWTRGNYYDIGDIVSPSVPNGFSYQVDEIINIEPSWPDTIGQTVVDRDIYWQCKNPTEFPPRMAWNQYYIISRDLTIR